MSTLRSSVGHINKAGALLVFPLKNKPHPASLWSKLHPRKKMKWEWTEDSDDSIADLWRLMKRLSSCGQVVYSKWYQGRATFFSRDLFRALLALSIRGTATSPPLSLAAKRILAALEEDSPLSTKELKRRTDLQGRLHEAEYARACKELYLRFLIVAYGEVDDGAFPSLAIGSTRLLFEDLWDQAQALDPAQAEKILDALLPKAGEFRRFYERGRKLKQSPSAGTGLS